MHYSVRSARAGSTVAARLAGINPASALHVGDDPGKDWHAAEAAGMKTFRLDRPNNSLKDLPAFLDLQRDDSR